MKRTTLQLGKINYSGHGLINSVDLEIEIRNKERVINYETLEEMHNVPELSICGNIWNRRKTDVECCGQCLDTIAEYISDPQFNRLKELWEQYHLNDLKAGTKMQTEYLNTLEANGWKYDYDQACEKLKEAGLYEDRGYKYGHGWLYMPIPNEVLEEIQQLCAVN